MSTTGGNSGRESVVSGTGTGLGSSGLMYVLLLRASNKVSTKSLVSETNLHEMFSHE